MAGNGTVKEAVVQAAGERLGVGLCDRPEVFREVADAAADNGLPYWTLLVLSGGIATLGLALDSAAIVIGAMLVAPLLAPVIALGLALAVGDGKLAAQAGAVVLASTLAVVLTGAALTAALPFETITLEISSRIRPSVLDLAVAVFSGVVGAVVTLARGSRLSAAIPGVAVAVALIPPLAVAGFGVGAGWHADVISGSMLLFAANLAGIVLSALLVFLLVGMHRPEVIDAARSWHRAGSGRGLVRHVGLAPWIRSLDVVGSPARRVLLVAGFVALLAVPLTRTLQEITRETRVRSAIDSAAPIFEGAGRASIISRQLVLDGDRATVYLRVATAEWYGDEDRHRFERLASARAGEPIHLVLEQLPATTGELDALADLVPVPERAPVPPPARMAELLGLTRSRAEDAVAAMPFPAGIRPVAVELTLGEEAGDALRIVYAGVEPLQPHAMDILTRHLHSALDHSGIALDVVRVAVPAQPFELEGPHGRYAAPLAAALERYPRLGVELLVAEAGDTAAVAAVEATLLGEGIAPEQITRRTVERNPPGVRVRIRAASRRLEDLS
jgi:uncharacterized hydrophobic protein (TIGR00271 family)